MLIDKVTSSTHCRKQSMAIHCVVRVKAARSCNHIWMEAKKGHHQPETEFWAKCFWRIAGKMLCLRKNTKNNYGSCNRPMKWKWFIHLSMILILLLFTKRLLTGNRLSGSYRSSQPLCLSSFSVSWLTEDIGMDKPKTSVECTCLAKHLSVLLLSACTV